MTSCSDSPDRSRSRGDQSSAWRRSCATISSWNCPPGQDTDHPRPHRRGEIPRLRDHRPARRQQAQPRPSINQRRDRAARTHGSDQAKCAPYLARGKPAHRTELMSEDDHTSSRPYGAEYRGIVQYYLLAGDVHRLQPPTLGHGDLDAQDSGRQAPLDGVEDGQKPQSQGRDTATGCAPVSRPASCAPAGSLWSPGSAASR